MAGLWTSAGVFEKFDTVPENSKLSVSLEKVGRRDDNSNPLPGALWVDPYVRSTAQREGMKVSENALWLVMVGMREYVKSLLKNTITTIDSVNESSALPDLSFLVKEVKPVTKENDRTFEDQGLVSLSPVHKSGKRKCVSALDLATYLTASSVTRGQVTNRLAFEQCYLSAFDPVLVASPSGFESIQTYISSGIDVSSSKRTRTQKDVNFHPPGTSSKENSSDPQSMAKNQEQAATVNEVQVAQENSTKTDIVKPPHQASMRRSPNIRGMGRGAKNLAALKARAAAAASAAKNDSNSVGDSVSPKSTSTRQEGFGPDQVVPTEPAAGVAAVEVVPVTESSRDEMFMPTANVNAAPTLPLMTTGSSESAAGALPADREKESGGRSGPTGVANTVDIDNNPHSRSNPGSSPAATGAFVETQSENFEAHVEQSTSSVNNDTAPPNEVFEAKLDETAKPDRNTGANTDNPISQRAVVRGRGFGVKNLAMMRARSAGGADDPKDEAVGEEEITGSIAVSQAREAGDKEDKPTSDHENPQKDVASEAKGNILESTSSPTTPREGTGYIPQGSLSANDDAGDEIEPGAMADMAGNNDMQMDREKEPSVIDSQLSEQAVPPVDSTV